MLTNDPNYSSYFAEYAIKLYNEVPKPLCKVNNYCEMIPKLKEMLRVVTVAMHCFTLLHFEVGFISRGLYTAS